jgi:hypothetical protein
VYALTRERMRRACKEGILRGRREAKLFSSTAGMATDRAKAIDWINTAVSKGRAELEAQRALESEVEAWDMACRGLSARDRLTLMGGQHNQETRRQRTTSGRVGSSAAATDALDPLFKGFVGIGERLLCGRLVVSLCRLSCGLGWMRAPVTASIGGRRNRQSDPRRDDHASHGRAPSIIETDSAFPE